MSWAYYNEIEPHAAEWLRELMDRDLIAVGDVDERSIEDVTPNDLKGYTQHHFFAGIGVWSHALRQAGWPDDRPVWTGSCPCQSFSVAGKGEGFADERHLWPAWFHLIRVCKPPVVFGEQVESKSGLGWLDLVQADLEGVDYACGAIVAPAAGFGAPHIRSRQYWVAHTERHRCPQRQRPGQRTRTNGETESGRESDRGCYDSAESSGAGGVAHPPGKGRVARRPAGEAGAGSEEEQRSGRLHAVGGVADSESIGLKGKLLRAGPGMSAHGVAQDGVDGGRPGPVNGFWANSDWLFCRDGKWRPARCGSFPLVAGPTVGVGRSGDLRTQIAEGTSEARVMRLRGYGNAIVAPQATTFIETVVEEIG